MGSSRARAQTWPYPRQQRFEETMRRVAARWFAVRDRRIHQHYLYILAHHDGPHNIIVPEVAKYIAATRATREFAGEGFALHKWIHHGLSS